MRQRLLELIAALRAAGIRVSPAETMDALEAVSILGVGPVPFREGLASVLVKDHADRPVFDVTFAAFFAAPRRARDGGEGDERSREGRGARFGNGASVHPPREEREDERDTRRASAGAKGSPRQDPARAADGEPAESARHGAPRAHEMRHASAHEPALRREDAPLASREQAERLLRQREARHRPFREMTSLEVDDLRNLVVPLSRRFRARLARRHQAARRARIDVRRTMRRSLQHGGVPLELVRRKRRPGRADLVALVDLSWSTATASGVLLSLLAPARHYFRRVRFLGYVAEIAEISFERGHVVPHERLDLDAPSDFGRVLHALATRRARLIGRDSVVLVLGDARNNRRSPRVEHLRALRTQARAVIWLNPDPPARWNTGDSVIAAYAPHVDALLPAHDVDALERALARTARFG